MKGFLLGAWLGAALVIAIGNAINGGIDLGMVVWGIATFAGWVVLVFSGVNGRAF